MVQQHHVASTATPPGKNQSVAIQLKPIDLTGELWLRVALVLRESCSWADKGHEVATAQFQLPHAKAMPTDRPRSDRPRPGLKVVESKSNIVVENALVRSEFNRETGSLCRLSYNGQEVFAKGPAAGPQLQAFRAPTDNDRGFGGWLADAWRDAGLEDLACEAASLESKQLNSGCVQVDASVTRRAKTGILLHRTRWTIEPNGVLRCDHRFEPQGEIPPLPRIGVVMRIANGFDEVEWFGRGPFENYPDRKEAADVGRWSSEVSKQLFPYPRPQESGSKQDTRWVALRDDAGRGLMVATAGEPFAFSALHYSASDLASTKRSVDLRPPRAETYLSLDARQCGLGNSSCGPGVLSRFAVAPVAAELSLVFVPLAAADDPGSVARRYAP